MVRALTLLSFIAAAFVVGSYAQSNTPNCFTCPPEDQLGFAVGQKNEATDPIFCSYPAVEGEDPNDFFCTYSFVCSLNTWSRFFVHHLVQTTGALVEDHDAGLCQSDAVNTCNQRKKREALPRSPRAGQQARSPKAEHMQTRSKLKKRRLDDQASHLFFPRWSFLLTVHPFRLKPAAARAAHPPRCTDSTRDDFL
jgi:hypothetical protein